MNDKEPAMGHDTSSAPHPPPCPQTVPTGYPLPAPPAGVARTYQSGVPAEYPSAETVGYPLGTAASTPPPPAHVPYATAPYYADGCQSNPGGAGAVGQIGILRTDRLPCWGLGLGWFLFIIGFFLAAIPWYVGAFFLLFLGVDCREKPGLTACTIAAVISAVGAFFGLMHQLLGW